MRTVAFVFRRRRIEKVEIMLRFSCRKLFPGLVPKNKTSALSIRELINHNSNTHSDHALIQDVYNQGRLDETSMMGLGKNILTDNSLFWL